MEWNGLIRFWFDLISGFLLMLSLASLLPRLEERACVFVCHVMSCRVSSDERKVRAFLESNLPTSPQEMRPLTRTSPRRAL